MQRDFVLLGSESFHGMLLHCLLCLSYDVL